MKKSISIFLAVIICILSFVMPSFALLKNDYVYETDGTTAVITGYVGSATSLVIPAKLDGISVSKIADGAFKNNINLTAVTVSSGISDIGASAFENCTSLATISFPTTIIHIGEKAIYNTAYYNNKDNWKLKRTETDDTTSGGVNVGGSGGNTQIDWEDISAPVLEYLYLGKFLIQVELEGNYSIKYGTLVIADGAFKGNTGAVDVGFPTSLVAVGCNAFEGCTSLTSVRNLNSAKYIWDNAFKDCTALEEINISETVNFNANAIFNTGFYNNPSNWENGTLYLGNRVVGTDPKKSETVIKDGATDIVTGALGNKDAVIPASVTSIAQNAFTSTDSVRIFGYSNTYAQAYATENNIPFIDLDTMIKGDVNFDGIINLSDYDILSSVSTTLQQQTYAISIAGDMDDDGAVDGYDMIILHMMIKEMPPSRLKGDVNGDGKVDRLDYDLLTEIVSTKEKITDNIMFRRSDINDDGAVDNFDAVYLDLALNGYLILT